MRIGIDARFYGSVGKGLGRYTEKLIEYLEVVDTENEYVIFLRQENFDAYQPKNKLFRKVLAQYQWYGFAEQLLYPLQLYRLHLDLMHFPHFNVPIFYRKKFIVTIHDLILVHYPTLRNTTLGTTAYRIKFMVYRFVIARAIRCAEAIITVSHFTEADILKHYPRARGKISVTYEAADAACPILANEEKISLFRRLGIAESTQGETTAGMARDILKPYLLYVGNAYPHKNLEALIKVAMELPEYLFVLVGKEDYFYARLKREAKVQGAKNVIFAGYLTDRELGALYRHGSLYIFPSLYEGFGLPPLEAMTHGLPVLSSSCGSLPEILGDAAFYFNPRLSVGLPDVIRSLMGNKEQREHLRMKGYSQAARYQFKEMVVATHALYMHTFENKEE